METITGFAASMLQSLGGNTEEAAKLSNQAVIDMADNANKMGSSMASIQNAYQGFAKQNYTMLDNLKLGYGGTAAEMYRLMSDAAELDEQFRATAQFSIDSKGHLTASFSDITKAIHIVQTELGITGTTSLEAGATISGSAAMMKSAWSNLVTGMADENASFTNLVIRFVGSVETFAENLLPRVEVALNGVVMLIEKLAPKIIDRLPSLVETVLPPLINAAFGLLDAVIEVLPSLAMTLIDVLADALVTNIPVLIPSVVDVVVKLAMMLTDPTTLENIINASLLIILTLADGIIDNLPKLIEAAPVIIRNLVTAIVNSLPAVLNTAALLVSKIIEGIKNNLGKILDAGTTIVTDIISGVIKAFGKLIETGGNIIINVKSGFSAKVAEAKTWGKDLIENFIDGIIEKWEDLKTTVSDVAQSVKDFIGFSEPKLGPLSNFHTYAPDMMQLFAQGIRDNEHVITDQIAKSFDFGQRTIDFASSAQGKSSAAMIHGMMLSDQSEPKNYVAELYLDGEKVAESTYKPTKKIQKREGEPALA
jgi:phage-related protein